MFVFTADLQHSMTFQLPNGQLFDFGDLIPHWNDVLRVRAAIQHVGIGDVRGAWEVAPASQKAESAAARTGAVRRNPKERCRRLPPNTVVYCWSRKRYFSVRKLGSFRRLPSVRRRASPEVRHALPSCCPSKGYALFRNASNIVCVGHHCQISTPVAASCAAVAFPSGTLGSCV